MREAPPCLSTPGNLLHQNILLTLLALPVIARTITLDPLLLVVSVVGHCVLVVRVCCLGAGAVDLLVLAAGLLTGGQTGNGPTLGLLARVVPKT